MGKGKRHRGKRGSSSEEEENSQVSSPDSETSSGTGTEREAKKKRISPGEEMEVAQVGVEEDEFTPKSPISMPYIPDELNDPTAYPATLAAYNEAHVKYKAKLNRRYRLFSMPPQHNLASSFMSSHRHLLPIRESAQKAVLHAAKSIIRLSSSVDGKPLANCCGLWIKWDEESKTGIVLTTAHLIRSNHPTENLWEGRDEYDIKSKVIVHLLDGKTADGHYLYHQEHYDLAFFKVRVDEEVEVPHFSASMHCGQDVFRLGRDDHMNLRITHGRVEYLNPGSYERHHYMHFFHQKNDFLSHQRNDDRLPDKRNDDYLCDDDGGSIIDLDGKVAGLVNTHLEKSFVPSSILSKCVDLWCKFRCIPRLHLRMNFISIKLLDPIHIEKMWRMYKIEDGLIVQEVASESHAEKLGICLGDIIERFNGKLISTTVELEKMLLGRCRDHLDQGGHLNENINISIQVFHTEERLRRNINLSVDVSDGGEVVNRRTYPITAIEGTSASGQSSQNVADDPCLPRRERTWASYYT
ncbi:uncharacterized protein LOC124657946 [Lolium rigidum]|uniref:uncharacterized protein LOC124657946 n=1 Tax=Lolium rigidum TaxID=89674 RepID=UPI001F5D0720|nr:uncharacterized protein LOC124657946 [Lolium rigidum]XP_047052368.1 uncharacterized protein LOC124657946 [Lolium rigidum]